MPSLKSYCSLAHKSKDWTDIMQKGELVFSDKRNDVGILTGKTKIVDGIKYYEAEMKMEGFYCCKKKYLKEGEFYKINKKNQKHSPKEKLGNACHNLQQTKVQICPDCNGKGSEYSDFIGEDVTCDNCGGLGKL